MFGKGKSIINQLYQMWAASRKGVAAATCWRLLQQENVGSRPYLQASVLPGKRKQSWEKLHYSFNTHQSNNQPSVDLGCN